MPTRKQKAAHLDARCGALHDLFPNCEIDCTVISIRRSGHSKTITAWTNVLVEVRLYDCLYVTTHPEAGGKDFIENLNLNSLKVLNSFVEPSLAPAKADDKFQFQRHGYFVADRVDHAAGKLVFNLAVGLKDIWNK